MNVEGADTNSASDGMLKSTVVNLPIRLLAVDIDGTLLNPQFQISDVDLAALRRAHESGIEVVLVTGRRHTFALPIAQMLGFDLWLISSNGAITRSLSGETFHRDLLPAQTCRTDRKSTRLNSSHVAISYAVFCLKKKRHQHT